MGFERNIRHLGGQVMNAAQHRRTWQQTGRALEFGGTALSLAGAPEIGIPVITAGEGINQLGKFVPK